MKNKSHSYWQEHIRIQKLNDQNMKDLLGKKQIICFGWCMAQKQVNHGELDGK